MIYNRRDFNKVGSKWFHHMGTMSVFRRKSDGMTCVVVPQGDFGKYRSINDCHLLDVFIWLGKYLARKGKLPRHLALDEIAIKTQRASKDIRAVIATEIFDAKERT